MSLILTLGIRIGHQTDIQADSRWPELPAATAAAPERLRAAARFAVLPNPDVLLLDRAIRPDLRRIDPDPGTAWMAVPGSGVPQPEATL